MANPGETFSRCTIPSCKKRIVDGQEFCHLHGGLKYLPKRLRQLPADDMRAFAFRFAVEDAVRHFHMCPACSEIPLVLHPWKWSLDDLITIQSSACDYGRIQIERIQECLTEGHFVPPSALCHGDKIDRVIELIILHFGRCPHCRQQRSELAVWDFTPSERAKLKKTGCHIMANLLNTWARQVELNHLGSRFAHSR